MEGIQVIKEHYIQLFNQHIALSNLTEAENDLAVLRELEINQVLFDGMEGKLAIARSQRQPQMEKAEEDILKQNQITMGQINQLLGSFKSSMENQNFNELDKISRFTPGRKQFIRQLFSQYKTMNVQISNIQFIPTRNKASARVILSDLTQNNGHQVMPGSWSHFQIDMRPDEDRHLKIHW